MKVNELIDIIKNELVYSLWDLPDMNWECVAREIDEDKMRWFSIATNVYKCEDGYVGVTGVNQIYSDYMSAADCEEPCCACEYQPIQTVTYVPKK